MSYSKGFNEIPPMPRIRNRGYSYQSTIDLWNFLPKQFTWQQFLTVLEVINKSDSWGYKRLSFWVKNGYVYKIETGIYYKVWGKVDE